MNSPRGDSQTVLTIYSDPEGGVDHSIVVNQVQQVVDGIIAGGIYVDGTYSTSFIGSYVTEPMGDSIRSATLHTVYGELDCDILLTQTNGVTTYLYVHDGSSCTRTVSPTSETAGPSARSAC